MLHTLVDSCFTNKENTADYIKVVDVIVEKSVSWWCHRNAKPVPLENFLAYIDIGKESMEYLQSGIFNEAGFSVISYAAFLGVKPLLKNLIQIPEIYVTRGGKNRSKGPVLIGLEEIVQAQVGVGVGSGRGGILHIHL